MIELPEAVRLARQIGDELGDRVIEWPDCGNSPHKWAFYSRPQEDYAELLPGRTLGQTSASGSLACVHLDPDMALLLGDGRLRVLLHGPGRGPPARCQLLLRFEDGSALTVSLQGWGVMHLVTREEAAERFAGHARRRLFSAVRNTIQDATKRGGRDTEKDLHGEPGGYRALLDSRAKGQPCRRCGTPIEKIQYLGGACCVCPACQT